MEAAGPTSTTPRSRCRAAASAPSTTFAGAKSPPMASTATQTRLFLVNGARLTAAVVAAVRAHAMRLLRLVAVRALGEPDLLQRVMRAALGRPRLGVSSFGI